MGRNRLKLWSGFIDARLRTALSDVPGDIVIAISHTDTLMCGRPAPCRPAVFASDTVHFFPLTAVDERSLRRSAIAQ